VENIATLHRKALEYTGEVVAGIAPGDWSLPTPCQEWDVRELANHLVSGNLWAAELARGRTIDEVGERLDGDVLGSDPGRSYRESSEAAASAFEAPGALDAPCAVSYGPVPGHVYAGHRYVDVLIHGWDLASATKQDTTMDPELVRACIEVVEPQLEMLQGSGMFGGASGLPDEGDDQARLLAMLGRGT
jgi:uncharacterized protein (TIGR03086 family)